LIQNKKPSVRLASCNKKFGKSQEVGTIHTHHSNSNIIGITPSDQDLTDTMEDSLKNNRKQISCILNDEAELMHCYVPRKLPTEKQIEKYEEALYMTHTLPNFCN
jgi:gamma-glutamylcysteine synthetase